MISSMKRVSRWSRPLALGFALMSSATMAADLRIGMRADPDILDPAQGGSVFGRVVFAALCDKLVDIAPDGSFAPQLATEWSWSPDNLTLTLKLRDKVLFHDGEPLNAEAVKVNLDRYRTSPVSRRKTELKPVESVEVVDPLTVKMKLTEPYAPLVSVLADRAGMIMSPKALAKDGDKIGLNPVCAGPFSFVKRVAQDNIQLKRFEGYWNRSAIHVDGILYRMIPDDSVRLLGPALRRSRSDRAAVAERHRHGQEGPQAEGRERPVDGLRPDLVQH